VSLRALAAHVGVLTEYISHHGERIDVRDDVLAAVLTAIGVDITLSDDRAVADVTLAKGEELKTVSVPL